MTRKFISSLICFFLIVNCFVGLNFSKVFAAEKPNVSISYNDVVGLISLAESTLSSISNVDRYNLYYGAKPYFEENDGIDSLISIISNNDSAALTNLGISESLISSINENKNEIIFILCVIKSIDPNARKTALANFTGKMEFTDLSSTEKTALNNIYEEFVSSDFRDTLLQDHEINEKVLLNLFSCIRGTFILTDITDNTSKLALKSINTNFADRLGSNLLQYFSSINIGSKSVSSGKDIMKAILSEINSSATNTMISNYKTVFGALDMYEKYVESPSSSGGGTISVGGNTVRYPNPSIPLSIEPKSIPAPVIDANKLALVDQFNDIDTSNWSAPYVSEMVSRNIFKGYDNGEFKPEQGITRQEFACALVRAMGLQARLDSANDTSFTDNDKIADWAKKSVSVLVEMKILTGYDDGSFGSENIITREEVAVILSRSLSQTVISAALNFTDKDSIDDWALSSVEKVFALGIIKGYEDNTFRPNNSVTRSEISTMLYNFMYAQNLL